MTADRIEEIIKQTAYPESNSVYQALLQVWTEVQHESNERIGSCKKCVSRAEDNHCEIYESMVTEDDWFCADFEPKKE